MVIEQTEIGWVITVEGKLEMWQHSAQTFESTIRMLADGLVEGADGLEIHGSRDGRTDDYYELCSQWWEDLDKLCNQARRQVLSRMIVRGIPEPSRFRPEAEWE